MLTALRSAFFSFRIFIFPNVCFLCKQTMNDDELRICNNCWSEIPSLEYHSTELESKREFLCRNGFVDDFTACFLFEKNERLQDIIHKLKYEEHKLFGVELGKRVGKKLRSLPKFTSSDFLVPVPLHNLKQRERGYNQSEYVAKGISLITKIPVCTKFLFRKKYTQSQTKLNFHERQENVKDVFGMKEKFQKIVSGKTIILVDDVITTGATVTSAASVMKTWGAKNIYTVSVALTAFQEENNHDSKN